MSQALTRAEMEEGIAVMEEMKRRKAARLRFTVYENRYPWQREFIAATKIKHESLLCCGNQTGKSETGLMIDAFHLVGDYPDDYPGHRFDQAPLCWCLGYSIEKTRDLLQNRLFGKYNPKTGFEGGLVPKDRILGHEAAAGTANAMRTVWVRHVTGNKSVMQFWSYTQGQHAIMGDTVDWVHVDEEPRDQTIRPQLITRTANGDRGRGGRIIYTLTPENGRTDLIIKFMDDKEDSQFFMMRGWDDCPHMAGEKAARLLATYPHHQRDMRTKGVPMLGHGRIYDIADEFVLCDPVPIQPFWKVIGGLDFGDDHPQGVAKLAIDMDADIVYVTNSWKASRVSANDAWGATKHWMEGVPLAWPHDGLQGEKGRDDAKKLKEHYVNAGFSMLAEHATWLTGGFSVENGIFDINDRLRKGTFRIFKGQPDLMEEVRLYHRDDKGKIKKVLDDLLSAIRYAYMMRRFAKSAGSIGVAPVFKRPPVIKPMGGRR